MQRVVSLVITLTSMLAIPMRATEASSIPRIVVYKDTGVTLSVKVTNTGKVPLEGVQVSLDTQSLPEWIQPLEGQSEVVNIPALNLSNKRPYGNVRLQFRVSKFARVGESVVIPFEIKDREGTTWKRFVRLDIQEKPVRSMLFANYPNPFNPETWIPYQLDKATTVRIQIYDIAGRPVRRFDLGYKEAGVYFNKNRAVYWDGKNESRESLASGVYFYSLYTAGELVDTRQMILLK